MSARQDFWARRRAGVAAEAQAERDAAEDHKTAQDQAAFDDMPDEQVLQALDLPDPDTLKQGDDFRVFMDKVVPDRIRRRALRTLWRSNPVLANVDMLVDYGEDFTDAALAVENIQTAYQVGKGMLKHIEEMARQAEERENPSEPEIEIEDTNVALAAAETHEVAPEAVDEPDPEDPPAEDFAEATAPAPRRMKFRIEEPA